MRHCIKISDVFHIIEASRDILRYLENFWRYLELFLRISRKIFRPNWGIPYILVYKSNACISQTLFLKPKIQLF